MLSLSVQNSKHRRFTPKQFTSTSPANLSRRNAYEGGSQRAKTGILLPLAFFLSLFLPYTLDLIPFTSAAYAASTVTVAWDKNPETDVIGYKFHYGTISKNYQYTVDVKNNTSCTISDLVEGKTYYFAATAYKDQNIESGYSEELVYTIPITSPPPPPPPVDTDGDGLFDDDETGIYGTDPNKADTDGDGMNDGDELAFWGDNWSDDSDLDGLVNLVDPDSDNDGYNDGTSPPPPPPIPTLQLPTLEVGEVSIDHNWTRVTLKKTFTDPVVVAQPLSLNDGEPAVIRVRNVDASGFEIRVQEWDYLDDVHAREKVSFLVLDRGSYALEDGTMLEAGSFETDWVGSFGGVTFSQAFQTMPVVVTTISSVNEPDAVTGRLRNISSRGFQFCMQEQELNPKEHAKESINYIAWEPSVGTVDGLPFEVGKTGDILTHGIQKISFSQAYTNAPVFLANIQTGDGMNTANVRSHNKNANTVEVQISEEQSSDEETSHTSEVLGYMAFTAPDLTETQNVPPTADAGEDQTVDAGDTVVLNGTYSSDPDDGIATYQWKQLEGTPVILTDYQAIEPNFVCPRINTANETLTFKLTVTDYSAATATDTVNILVNGAASNSALNISNLSNASAAEYLVVEGLANGDACYIDRSYTYGNVPDFLQGAAYIKTANNDKNIMADPLLSFDVNRNVTVYVAFDNRAPIPFWMSDFTDTGYDMKTDVPFSIYAKDFPAGSVNLGPNGHSGSIYTVIIK